MPLRPTSLSPKCGRICTILDWGARADGALIVNYNIETDPKDRSLAYADDNEDQLDDLIFIDTRVLYKLTAAIIDGHLSVEEAKKILFKKGRVAF